MFGLVTSTEISMIKRETFSLFSWSLHFAGGDRKISVPKLSKVITNLCKNYKERKVTKQSIVLVAIWKMIHYREWAENHSEQAISSIEPKK